jgi:hypothetical protein
MRDIAEKTFMRIMMLSGVDQGAISEALAEIDAKLDLLGLSSFAWTLSPSSLRKFRRCLGPFVSLLGDDGGHC